MRNQGRILFVGSLATILVAACFGFAAGGSHKSQERKVEVTFSTMTKFNNGTTLPAGTYRMEIPENSQTPAVTFSQNGKVVATVEAKVVTEQRKNDATEVDTVSQGDAQLVRSIRPGGWTEEIDFGS
jgi:hypothetical protein